MLPSALLQVAGEHLGDHLVDLATFPWTLGDAQRLAPILEDERRFIDHARTSVGLYPKLESRAESR